jgi:TPR repeat protein
VSIVITMPMTLIARSWQIAVLFGLLTLSPAHAGMTPKEMIWFKDFSVMAEKGEAEGQLGLGICYTRGHGVAKDDVQAAAWFRKAADQGLAGAQTLLGNCYYDGVGVPKDQALAVSWYRKAADQGNTGAQYSLGGCYANGIGVAKDFVQAVKWWRQASERGYVLAQYHLGGCYANGEGVEKNQIEAYAYWNQGTVEYARRKLAALEKQMTPEQITAGKKRTKELKRELEDKIYENARQKEFAAKIAEKPDRK